MNAGDRYKYRKELADKLRILSPETSDRIFVITEADKYHVRFMMQNGLREFLEPMNYFLEMFEEFKDEENSNSGQIV